LQPTPSKLEAVLAFLNLHPDLVGKYVDSTLAPSDCGDKDCLAVLSAVFSLTAQQPRLGHPHRFCIGSHSASFEIKASTPARISKLTVDLHTGEGPDEDSLRSESRVRRDMRVVEVVEVMKYWTFPAAIVSALESGISSKHYY
jgi:hypothetical protein